RTRRHTARNSASAARTRTLFLPALPADQPPRLEYYRLGKRLRPIDAISKIQSDFYLIRETAGESLFLLRGSTSALLIGTGGGAPILAAFVHSLIADLPLDVAI